MAVIAVCGTGLMGSAVAGRLLDVASDVVVWNRTRARLGPLVSRGATAAASPSEARRLADAVLVMVADAAAVHEVVLGPDGAASAPGDAPIVQLSTLSPLEARRLADALPPGVLLLDAPTTGSVPEATTGTLRLLAGGDAALVRRCALLLEPLGEVVHVGPIGAGSAMKTILNAATAPIVALLAEALALAATLALPLESVLDELERSRIGSLVARKRSRIESGVYPAASRLDLHAKDLAVVMEEAARAGVSVDVLAAAHDLARQAVKAGLGGEDYSVLVRYLADRGGRHAPADR